MEIKQFTEDPKVFHLLKDLKEQGVDQKKFSDLVDENNNQYVELVQEGGGVLGVALIGYTYIMEQMGLRFFSLAGTSAGAINTMLLASLGDISEPKSEKLIHELANKDLFEFVDGDGDAVDFVNAVVDRARRVKFIWKAMQIIDNIFEDLGLNPGNDFFNWLTDILKRNDVDTTEKLLKAFQKLPEGLKIREGVDRNIDRLSPRLAMIAAELTTETKVEFPKMKTLYWKEHEKTNPAWYVRASMSIPYFFEPVTLKDLPRGPEAMELWDDLTGYRGIIPRKVHFVDGGIMSNFPIDIFHKFNTVPRLPTFRVRLGVDRDKPNKISSPLNLFGAMFNSIRHLHDYDFFLQHPDYSMLVQHIDIGKHDWLNFRLNDEAKIDLFRRGAVAAAGFLRSFDWQKYKQRREELKTKKI